MTSESALCAACGMCCDGTLFAHGMLEPGEAEPPDAAVTWEEDARCFVQPCPQYNGGCRIYADRPGACRAFRCSVLQDLATGQIDATTVIIGFKHQFAFMGDQQTVITTIFAGGDLAS